MNKLLKVTLITAIMATSGFSIESQSKHSFAAMRHAGGDPIMRHAGGDPIMRHAGGDPIMRHAGGDPIMRHAGGDPIMRHAGGDPIMRHAGGDPIMRHAGGDPIMRHAGGDPIMRHAGGDPIMRHAGCMNTQLFNVGVAAVTFAGLFIFDKYISSKKENKASSGSIALVSYAIDLVSSGGCCGGGSNGGSEDNDNSTDFPSAPSEEKDTVVQNYQTQTATIGDTFSLDITGIEMGGVLACKLSVGSDGVIKLNTTDDTFSDVDIGITKDDTTVSKESYEFYKAHTSAYNSNDKTYNITFDAEDHGFSGTDVDVKINRLEYLADYILQS